jgi:riboflavin biosynthesis pyrimidine reductase
VTSGKDRADIEGMMESLHDRGIARLMVEGGLR